MTEETRKEIRKKWSDSLYEEEDFSEFGLEISEEDKKCQIQRCWEDYYEYLDRNERKWNSKSR